ncbi:MAG: prepilin-type N-terminal cleavage/methylation domain-containing protein [Candidatus Woykebacteria bacterium]
MKQRLVLGKKGFSLIEILVATAIFSIIIVAVTELFTRGYTSYYSGYFSYKAQTESIAAVHRMGKETRQAVELIDASTQSVTIYEYVRSTDPAPSQVRFFLDTTTLKRGEILATGAVAPYTYNPASETFRIVSDNVVNGATPIFTYFDQNGSSIAQPVSEPNVTLIQIDVQFGRNNFDDPFPVSTKVQIRNKKINL